MGLSIRTHRTSATPLNVFSDPLQTLLPTSSNLTIDCGSQTALILSRPYQNLRAGTRSSVLNSCVPIDLSILSFNGALGFPVSVVFVWKRAVLFPVLGFSRIRSIFKDLDCLGDRII